ncbi:hypothetical protein PoB_000558600 [Plakobranchus ocellatus]|uniref:Uncharacterized protein n=1 Tax=Plakobranchus ocellatus TaxID=259542 RepID=A0AAV3Y782_9GAST|nr:hypothetical protein PoB_000558600 [Plakobranchus ocellatus]
MAKGVGDTVVSAPALISAGNVLLRVRAPPPAPWPDRGPQLGDLKAQALRQARVPMAGLEPAAEKSLRFSGRIRWPVCISLPGHV